MLLSCTKLLHKLLDLALPVYVVALLDSAVCHVQRQIRATTNLQWLCIDVTAAWSFLPDESDRMCLADNKRLSFAGASSGYVRSALQPAGLYPDGC